MSPTVFNFYSPDYQPVGPVAETGLTAPEAQLGTGPNMVGFLNKMSTAVRTYMGNGRTNYAVEDPWDVSGVTGELDLLLTGGRLSKHARGIIEARYQSKMAVSAAEALRWAQELFLFTAEFHSTNLNGVRYVPRAVALPTPSQGRPYRAVVYLYLNGGADTYNLIVPTGGCGINGAEDVASQYTQYRGLNALPFDSLLPIASSVERHDSNLVAGFGFRVSCRVWV